MKMLLLFAASVSLFAQTLTPTSSAIAAPGLTFPVDIILSGAPTSGPGINGLQFTATIPTGWSIASVTAATGKTIACASIILSTLPGQCIIYSLDPTASMVNGKVGTLTYAIPATQASSTIAINLSGLVLVDTTGALTGAAAGNNLNVPIINYDVNGDGVVSAADIVTEISQILGATPCTTGDLNKDGNCKLNDLFLMIQAWVSYGSHTTP